MFQTILFLICNIFYKGKAYFLYYVINNAVSAKKTPKLNLIVSEREAATLERKRKIRDYASDA